ncbi:MAG: AraC family transcriptional regulator [Mycobacteriales bacterium]
MLADPDLCYQAMKSRDSRFDGWFFVAVTSTKVYCRPSCPAGPPKRANARFYPSAAAAQAAGFRACKRCRPDATPGSPDWNIRADLVGRAMRLIGDGVVDREGVTGLARRLGFSERHVHRQLVAEVGAGPIAVARAQRAQTARVLLETTDLGIADVAFAAGFASVRQFNDTIREVFTVTPTELRRAGRADEATAPGTITVRLPYRAPIDLPALFEFLAIRAVPGIEEWDGTTYRRSLALPHGPAVVALAPPPAAPTRPAGRPARAGANGRATANGTVPGPVPDEMAVSPAGRRAGVEPARYVQCALRLADVRDLPVAVQRCRRLLDLDADPVAVAAALGGDPLLGPLVAASPGRRVPGHVDGAELAVRAVLGQQVTVAAARTLAGRLVTRYGTELADPLGTVTHLFPDPATLAGADLSGLGMPAARLRALTGLAGALAAGDLVLDPGADRVAVHRQLLDLPGIGPWTASYVIMRAVGDPDVFLPTDVGVRHGLERLGAGSDPRAAAALAECWRPWRSYALLHLWGSAGSNGRN